MCLHAVMRSTSAMVASIVEVLRSLARWNEMREDHAILDFKRSRGLLSPK